jgi:hypothetical protein
MSPGDSMGLRYVVLLLSVNSHKIDNNSTTTKAREKKLSHIWNPNNFRHFLIYVTRFENNKLLLDKISQRFLLTTKLFNG